MAKITVRDKEGKVISTTDTKTGKSVTSSKASEKQKRDAAAIQKGTKERIKEKTTGRTQPTPKKTVLPPIEAKKEKKGIGKFAETKVGKVLTSPKTTLALATTLAGGLGLAAKAGAAGLAAGRTAVITRTATRGFGSKAVTLTTQRAFVGRSATSNVNKIFHTTRATAARFGTNAKTTGLTKSLFSKAGLSVGAAGLLVTAIGTYPFAGFIKEEALQTLGFAFNTAERNKDVEGMELAITNVEEILDNADSIMDKIPFANVLKQLKSFFGAVETKLNVDKRRLETLRGEAEAGETAFQEERRESDEASNLREQEFNVRRNEVFELRREGKFEEADELELEILNELKGGVTNE